MATILGVNSPVLPHFAGMIRQIAEGERQHEYYQHTDDAAAGAQHVAGGVGHVGGSGGAHASATATAAPGMTQPLVVGVVIEAGLAAGAHNGTIGLQGNLRILTGERSSG